MGIQSGSGNVGVMLAYLSVGFLAQRFGWKTPLFVWAGFGPRSWSRFGMLGPARRLLAQRGSAVARAAGPGGARCAAISRFVPGFFFGGMGWSVTIYYAPSLLNHKFGIPMGRTGLIPGPLDRAGHDHRLRLRRLEPPLRPQERLSGQPGRRRGLPLSDRASPATGRRPCSASSASAASC